jgi:hypothetical protein
VLAYEWIYVNASYWLMHTIISSALTIHLERFDNNNGTGDCISGKVRSGAFTGASLPSFSKYLC